MRRRAETRSHPTSLLEHLATAGGTWWLVLAIILAATWLVYMPGLTGGWFLDDYGNIVNNNALALPDLSFGTLWHAMWSFNAGPLGRPISLATFAVERYLFGLNTYAFKVTNLAMHLATAFFLAGFTRSLLRAWRQRFAQGISLTYVDWMALAVIGLWALHPVNLEPVLYTVQREAILAVLFMACGLWAYVALRQRLGTTWVVLALLVVVVALFTGLSALSKETGVLLPVFLLLIEFFIFQFRDHDGARARKLWLLYVLLLVLPAAGGLYWTLPSVLHGGYVSRDFTLGERVLTESRVVIFYLGLILGPRLSAMSLYHDDFTISTGLLSPPTTLLSFLLIGLLLLLAWALRRRSPLVGLGIAWFFAGQVLESTIWPLEIAFEHRIYLADWGIILAVVFGAAWLARRIRWRGTRPVLAAVACLAVAGVGSATAVRAWHWRSDLALAKVESRDHPQSPRATYLLARIYTNKALDGKTQYVQPAFEAARKAARVRGSGLDPWVAMVLLAAQTGRSVKPAWFNGMITAVGQRPFTVSDVNALEALVGCYTRHQCHIKRTEIERLFAAIDRSPHLQKLGMNYANVLVTEANFIGYDTSAQRMRSAPLLKKAADVQPEVAQFQLNVFNIALQEHDLPLARKMLARVERLNKIGKLDYMVGRMHRELQAAERRHSGTQ